MKSLHAIMCFIVGLLALCGWRGWLWGVAINAAGKCDSIARFLNAGKREAAAQIVRRKAALIARQNEKGRNPKRKK